MIATLKINRPSAAGDSLLARLNRLDAANRPSSNRNERAIALISACIVAGVNTLGQIIGMLKPLGFGRQHVAILVNKGTGPTPARFHWRRDADGTLHLHD